MVNNIGWVQVFTLFIAIVGVFFAAYWNLRGEIRSQIGEIREETRAINKSMTDFHGRLCALQEKYYQIEKRIDDK